MLDAKSGTVLIIFSSHVLVGGGVRKAGFKGGGRVELYFSSFCKIAACVKLGVTSMGLRGVDNGWFSCNLGRHK